MNIILNWGREWKGILERKPDVFSSLLTSKSVID